MLIQTSYAAIRSGIKPGDVIAFSGSGWISGAIKFFTRSCVSHVGVVYEINLKGHRRIKLMESTTLNGYDGVQETYLSERLESHNGPVWWLPLSERVRKDMDAVRFWRCLWTVQAQKTKYDYRQAFHHAVDLLHLWAQSESPGRLFCSELVALALKSAYVLPVWINSSEIRPVDLCAFRIYSDNYYQLRGKPAEIKGYNSINPMEWRNG